MPFRVRLFFRDVASLCTVSDVSPFQSNRVISVASPERHIGRSLRFRWRVYLSNKAFQSIRFLDLPGVYGEASQRYRRERPMCRSAHVCFFRNVASLCTVSDGFTFEIQPGYIRRVPGTAHRPFPTVSLVGPPFNRSIRKHPFF